MNRSFKIKLASAMVFFTAFAAVSSTIAWFIPAVSVTNSGEITGVTEGAYYAYGEGTAEKPFGITRPRHLYNLAWLQYLGTYNKASENGKPYYFELGDNVDMTDWVLPPIGDENTPFYGNFNGNGYVVSNLTISNDFNDLGKHPSTVSTFNQPHILGFFGVIGNYSGATLSAYSSSANEFLNTGLTGLTVKTVLKNSLIGIAAGYVDATMKNVAVDASTLNVAYSGSNSTSYGSHTTNISDYSLVGYTTKKSSIKKAEETIYSVNVSSGYEFNATDQGESTGWGGSIDMMSVTKRLQTIRDTVSNSRFTWKKTYDVHDGVKGNPTSSSTQSGNNNYTRLVNNNDQIGHFNFITGDSNVNGRYALLGGGHWETDNYYVTNKHEGHKITDGTNYLSLDTSNTTFTNETNNRSATIWTFDYGTSTISYKYESTTYYLYNNNGTLNVSTYNSTNWTITSTGDNTYTIKSGDYYLVCNGGWTLYNPSNPTQGYYIISDGTHYLADASQYHALSTTDRNSATKFYWNTSSNRYYPINNSNYYLGYYSDSYPVQIWSDGDYYYRLVDNSNNEITNHYGTGYLRAYSSRGAAQNYYVAWSGSNTSKPWTATNKSNATQMTVEYISSTITNFDLSKTAVETVSGPDESLESTTTGMNYEEDDVTYFPLNTVNNTSDFKPSDNNTAYVVGGSSLSDNVTYNNNVTNVRFGYYPIEDYIDNDYDVSSGTFTHVYTINNNMQKVEITNNTSDYEKLADAKTNLAGVMKSDGTNVYGLHFMSAEISMNALTTAKYVKVNKHEYTDYELPVNSIDFHLKEFGYINFMAGSYFPGNSYQSRNDSFFALYQIERLASTPNKINRIFEVLNVYQHSSKNKSYSYVYQLKDTVTGTTLYTKPYKIIDSEGNKEWLYDTENDYAINQYETSLPANYNLVFNCARIKKNSISQNNFLYHAWYFEIPMNDGEFCLGSDSSGVGSYLMYLDIGANAAKTQRTILYEKFTLTEKNYSYPLGVSLYTLPEAESIESNTKVIPFVIPDDDTNLIDASDSACMTIKASSSGVFEIDRNGSDVALTRAQAANAPPVYSGETITLIHESGDSTALEVTAESSNTYTIKRMQYYDYNVNLETTTVTKVTDTSVNGGAYSRTIYQYNYTSSDTTGDPNSTYAYDQSLDTPLDQRANIKIYNTTTGVKIDENTMISTSSFAINDSELSDSVILAIRLVQTGGDEYDDDTRLVAVVNTSDTSGTYYIFNQYKITLTPESGSIRITVTNYVTGNTIYFGTTQVTGKDQVITIPAP